MEEINDSMMSVLERFVVLLYDKTSDQGSVNDARKQLFTQKSRSMENILVPLYSISNVQVSKQIAGTEPYI